MVYCESELDASPIPQPQSGKSLKFTLWTLAIAAIAGLAFMIQRYRAHHADRKAHSAKAQRHRESRAASDRRDIQALMTSLQANQPETDAPAQTAAAPVARGRRSFAAPQGFDPDLPPR